MATTLIEQIVLQITTDYGNALDFRSIADRFTKAYSFTLQDGAGLNQATLVAADQRTLTASATEDIDCSGGTFPLPAFSSALTLTKLKAIIVYADPLNTNNVNVQRHASAGVPFLLAVNDGMGVTPGNLFVLTNFSAAGWTVTNTTADLITITNSAGSTSVTYDVWLIGA
jgi:hypothetical protein